MQEHELPPDWAIAKLKDITSKLVDGSHNPPVKQGDGLPMLSAVSIYGNQIDFMSGRLISEIDFIKESSRTKIESDDILLTIVGTIGRSAVVPKHAKPFTLQRSVAVMSVLPIEPKFLMYQFEAWSLSRYLNENAKGTAQKGIYLNSLGNAPITIAPLNEQKRIVDKIEQLFSNLDEGEALLKQVQKQLATYRQSVLKAAVTGELTKEWREANKHCLESGDALLKRILKARRDNWNGRGKYKESKAPDISLLPSLPESWTWTTVDNLSLCEKNSIKAGPFGSALKKEYYVEQGYKIYGQEQVISGDWNYGDYFIDVEKYKQLKSCEVKPFDVLISLVGTIGKVLVLPEQIQAGIINPRLIKISLDRSVYNPSFFKSYFESQFLKSLYKIDAHGATMDVLNLNIIRKLPFILCPIEEQGEIVSRIDDLFSQIDALGKWCASELSRSATLRQSILKDAFSGKLVPQDPSDEPASELLKRIQEERAKAAKPKSSASLRPRGRRKIKESV